MVERGLQGDSGVVSEREVGLRQTWFLRLEELMAAVL